MKGSVAQEQRVGKVGKDGFAKKKMDCALGALSGVNSIS